MEKVSNMVVNVLCLFVFLVCQAVGTFLAFRVYDLV